MILDEQKSLYVSSVTFFIVTLVRDIFSIVPQRRNGNLVFDLQLFSDIAAVVPRGKTTTATLKQLK